MVKWLLVMISITVDGSLSFSQLGPFDNLQACDAAGRMVQGSLHGSKARSNSYDLRCIATDTGRTQ